ncbi:response regulator [Sphingobacteriaceae bacterium]|nr:response regulator [Sphingobacteriaceae bacterium]
MKTVFLIDDDLDDREIFQEALHSIDLSVIYLEAGDGQQALQMIMQENFVLPNLIFVDLNMPRVGGLEFLQKVRLFPDYKNIPIYVYSTSSAQADADKCLKAGATGFITKHNSFDDLKKELTKLLK